MSKVIYASSKDSDMLYATGARIMDPFFLIDTGNKKRVFLDHREYGVFQEENKTGGIEPVLLDPLLEQAGRLSDSTGLENKLAWLIFKKYGLARKQVEVPASFPLDMADFLRDQGVKLIPKTPFHPERMIKTPEEVKYIKKNINKTCLAFKRIEQILKISKIKDDHIFYRGRPLTSELIKREADKLLLKEDMVNEAGIIISTGPQAAIPHHRGAGVIRPHRTIVCDIFPRDRATGYFADMTRTFVKGRPTAELAGMYAAVLKAQEAAIKFIRPGVSGKDVHDACAGIFLDLKYETTGDKGFIHGTGHGLGLDIHEGPYLNKTSVDILEPGNVVTVEPGLYYPEHGGMRIEDVVVVTEGGCKNLTKYHKNLVIT